MPEEIKLLQRVAVQRDKDGWKSHPAPVRRPGIEMGYGRHDQEDRPRAENDRTGGG